MSTVGVPRNPYFLALSTAGWAAMRGNNLALDARLGAGLYSLPKIHFFPLGLPVRLVSSCRLQKWKFPVKFPASLRRLLIPPLNHCCRMA